MPPDPLPFYPLHIVAVLGKLAKLQEIHGPELRVVEIGVYQANLTSHILTWFDKCLVWGIDPWRPHDGAGGPDRTDGGHMRRVRKWDQLYRIAQGRIDRHSGAQRCELVRMTSDEAVRTVGRNFHLIFVDGLHTFGQASRDIKNWYPLLASRGVMGGHDRDVPGVAKALKTVGRPYTCGVSATWWYEPKVDARPRDAEKTIQQVDG